MKHNGIKEKIQRAKILNSVTGGKCIAHVCKKCGINKQTGEVEFDNMEILLLPCKSPRCPICGRIIRSRLSDVIDNLCLERNRVVYMVTLTFPDGIDAEDKDDVAKYWKRFRSRLKYHCPDEVFTYVKVIERGDKTNRLHLHLLVLGERKCNEHEPNKGKFLPTWFNRDRKFLNPKDVKYTFTDYIVCSWFETTGATIFHISRARSNRAAVKYIMSYLIGVGGYEGYLSKSRDVSKAVCAHKDLWKAENDFDEGLYFYDRHCRDAWAHNKKVKGVIFSKNFERDILEINERVLYFLLEVSNSVKQKEHINYVRENAFGIHREAFKDKRTLQQAV